MEKLNIASNRKGKSLQRTSPLVYRAVEVLMNHFNPLEIMELLGLKRRTTYYIIERIRQAQYEKRIVEEERERREREKCARCREEMRVEMERKDDGVTAASLRPEWQKAKSSAPLPIRKFHS